MGGGLPLSPPVGKTLNIIINLLINLSIVTLMNLSWSNFIIIIIILFIFQMIVQPYKMFYFSSFKKQATLLQAHSI